MTDILISIDIGLHGAITFFEIEEKDHPSHGLLSIHGMPVVKKVAKDKEKNVLDLERLLYILERCKIHGDSAVVVYEDVHAFPGQGVVAVGTLLEQKGIIRGMAKALGYTEFPTSPRVWQKYHGIIPPKELKGDTMSKTKQLRKKWLKAKSLEVARNMFPDWDISHDGISDALLMGVWYLNQIPVSWAYP
jgi:hypothetical protein